MTEAQLRWKRIGYFWLNYPQPRPRSPIPLARRMHSLATCEVCHDNPVLRIDRHGGRLPIEERLCRECLETDDIAVDAARWPYDYDKLPLADLQEYQDERRSEPTGEQRLAAALIHIAACDVSRNTRYYGGDQNRATALAWLWGRGAASMSFADCCALLNQDPNYIRRGIFANGERLSSGEDGQRRFTGVYENHPAVDEDVPDVSNCLCSSPIRRGAKPLQAAVTP